MKKVLKIIGIILLLFFILVVILGGSNDGETDNKNVSSSSGNVDSIDFSKYEKEMNDELAEQLVSDVMQKKTPDNVDKMMQLISKDQFAKALRGVVVKLVHSEKGTNGPLPIDDTQANYSNINIRPYVEFYMSIMGSSSNDMQEYLKYFEEFTKKIKDLDSFAQKSKGYVYFDYVLEPTYSDSKILSEIEKFGNEVQKSSQEYVSYIGTISQQEVVLLVNKDDEFDISSGENYVIYEYTDKEQELIDRQKGFKSKAPIVKVIKPCNNPDDLDYEFLKSGQRTYLFYILMGIGVEGIGWETGLNYVEYFDRLAV